MSQESVKTTNTKDSFLSEFAFTRTQAMTLCGLLADILSITLWLKTGGDWAVFFGGAAAALFIVFVVFAVLSYLEYHRKLNQLPVSIVPNERIQVLEKSKITLKPQITKQEENQEPKEKPKRNPVIICTSAKLDDVIYDRSKVKHPYTEKDSYTNYKESQALIIEFFNKPLTNVKSVGETIAIIKFFDEKNNELAVIKSGIWMERYSDNSHFDTGNYMELSVALLENNFLYLLERERLENPKTDSFSSYNKYRYDFRKLDGKSFNFTVDLILKDFGNRVITSKIFKFYLKIKPKFECNEIKTHKLKK